MSSLASTFIISSRSTCCPLDEGDEAAGGIIFLLLFAGIIFSEELLDEDLELSELLSLLSLSLSMSDGIWLIIFFAARSLCLSTDLSFGGVS